MCNWDSHPDRPAGQLPDHWVLSSYLTDVSIIIVNYKTRVILERALETIFTACQASSFEVIVIDNASGDGSVEMVRNRFPQVRCLVNERNLGHTGGCNQGMALAKGRYLFLLNSDTMMLPGAIDFLVAYMNEHPHVGAAAPKVLNVDGTVQGTVKKFPTPWSALFGRFSLLTRWLPRNRFSRSYLIYLDQDFSQPFAVDSASGAALLVRREAIERSGPLDARFFLYWNDVDWCRSIWGSGWEVHCVPAAVLKHEEHHGGSRAGAWQRVKTVINFHRGAYLYYRKWHVRRFWQPSHLIAVVGLSVRAVIVIVADLLQGLVPRERACKMESADTSSL